ncbi:YARHG domain-containing protein [Hugenholtzia roseola]|uniref:YARHG domain-containing protein n=1 Tax=Hugenholtzia roseola TaxID=1002 RepID=UPI00040D68EC|nr:YARHG domain-containing protein [Hugenholtzia roseola]
MTQIQKFLLLPFLFWVGVAGTLIAQRSVSGFSITFTYGSGIENYSFCPEGRLVHESMGMYRFGFWEQRGGDVFYTFNATFVPTGFGKRDNMGGANLPDWAYYEHHYYEFRSEIERLSFNADELAQGEWETLDANTKRIYCGKGDFSYIGDYPQASLVPLSEGDMIRLTKSQLKIMRNEIYARYGYIFKTEAMKNHFANKAWYQPTKSNVDNLLTPLEQANIALIQKYEK